METSTLITQSYLTFRLADELFAANVNKVLEILEIPKITRVPRSPDFMRGVINLRGSVLPVIDTRIKFGIGQVNDTINSCIVVLSITIDDQHIIVGAVVDAVQEVMDIPDSSIQAAPSVGSNYQSEFILGMVKLNDEFIMLLDLDRVFSTEETDIFQSLSGSEN